MQDVVAKRNLGGPGNLLLALRIIDSAVVHEADNDWTARDRLPHSFAERQRRTALERRIDRGAVLVADFRWRIVARIGPPRRRDDLAIAFEGKADGILHAVL